MSTSPKFSATVVTPVSPTDNEGDPEGVNLNNFFSLMNKSGAYIFIPCRDIWPRASVDARLPPMPVLNKDGNPRRGSNGKIIYQPASKWLDKNRPVEMMTWAPGLPLRIPDRLISLGGWIERKDVSCFNLYRPPRIKLGDASKAKFWLDHVYRIYPDDADHIIKWRQDQPRACTRRCAGHRQRLFAGAGKRNNRSVEFSGDCAEGFICPLQSIR